MTPAFIGFGFTDPRLVVSNLNEFVHPAFGIVKKRKTGAIENIEKMIPIYGFQTIVGFTEVDPKHSTCPFYLSGTAAVALHPLLDFIVIGRLACTCQSKPPLEQILLFQ